MLQHEFRALAIGRGGSTLMRQRHAGSTTQPLALRALELGNAVWKREAQARHLVVGVDVPRALLELLQRSSVITVYSKLAAFACMRAADSQVFV